MIKTTEELKLRVKKARLLTRQELNDYEERMPDIPLSCEWWLADVDDYGDVAYAEGNYTEEDAYCPADSDNTWLRVALDIEGDINVGDEFVCRGYVFTAISEDLAISNNFLGCAKYLDEGILSYMEDDGGDCTITALIDTML